MKTKNLGIVLIVVGILMTVYTGFNYTTTEKLVDIGPIKINKEKNHPVQWKPALGIVIIIGGIIVIEHNNRKRKRAGL